MRKALTGLPIILAAGLFAGAACASPLNTGVASDGSLLTAGATDSAWTGQDVTNPQSPVNLTAYAVSGYGSYWLTDPGALFISPLTNGSGQAGNYGVQATIDWTQDFILTSNQAASDILGRFAVDNALAELIVNGNVVANVSGGSFNAFSSFDIPVADLVTGANVIEFVTQNYSGGSGNPTGLMVEFTQIPEPASVALIAAGLLGLGIARRRVA